MIKLIVSDIDGTLLPIGGKMSERTRTAIKNCISRGAVFVPASGRRFDGAAKPFRDMGIDCPVISANGGRIDAHCYESPIFENRVDGEMSLRICKRLIEAGCFMTSYVGTQVYMLPETNGYGSTCAKVSEVKSPLQTDIASAREIMLKQGTLGPYKFEAYSDDKAMLDSLRSEFSSWGLSVSGAFEFNIEIMAPGAGKGEAVKWLSDRLDVLREEIMALGDGSNDITLLNAAGVAVAMHNASPKLKPFAAIIAPDANEDGAAQILERYVLSEQSA